MTIYYAGNCPDAGTHHKLPEITSNNYKLPRPLLHQCPTCKHFALLAPAEGHECPCSRCRDARTAEAASR